MTSSRCRRAAIVLAVAHASAAAAGWGCCDRHRSDWPCVQRLVPELAAGQLWGGTSLDRPAGGGQARTDAGASAGPARRPQPGARGSPEADRGGAGPGARGRAQSARCAALSRDPAHHQRSARHDDRGIKRYAKTAAGAGAEDQPGRPQAGRAAPRSGQGRRPAGARLPSAAGTCGCSTSASAPCAQSATSPCCWSSAPSPSPG